MKDYSNAYAEAYIILNYLSKEDFNKIPKEIMEVLERRRNIQYTYEVNEELDLINQPMLPETKALLYNLFRDYLSTPVQKEKIKRMQQEDRIKYEIKKKENYGEVNIFKKKVKSEFNKEETKLIVIKKDTIFQKIRNFIKKILMLK